MHSERGKGSIRCERRKEVQVQSTIAEIKRPGYGRA